MTSARRLLPSVLAWAVSIPSLSLAMSLLERHRLLDVSGFAVSIVGIGLLLWAGLIYWRWMPPAPTVALRLIGAVAYLIAMSALGAGAVWVTFWATVLIFGV